MRNQTSLPLGLLVSSLFATAAFADTQIWTGAGSDQNWSTGGNWTNATAATSGTAPGSTDDVKFYDSSFLSPTVDGSFGGTISSLHFGATNNNYTTTIASGQTLNLTGNGGLFVFTPNQELPTATKSISSTIAGAGGTLSINNINANLVINQGNTNVGGGRATLDLSGLDTFAMNGSRVGIGTTSLPNTLNPGGGAGNQRNLGTLYLARTNTITLNYTLSLATYLAGNATNAIEISKNPGNNPGAISFLYLGQTNALFVDSLGIGRDKASTTAAGWMGFNPAVVGNNPVAYFRGISGGLSRVTWWAIGDMNANASTSQHAVGTNDFTGGAVDALVDTMSLGRDCTPSHTATGSGRINTGVLTFNAGTIDVNTLYVGNQALGPSTSTTLNHGYVNINGTATLVVNNNLILASTVQNSTAAQQTFGRISINGGTLRANSVTVGANSVTNANIIMTSSSTFVLSNTLASASKPLRTLDMSDSTFLFHLTGIATHAYVTNLLTGGSGNTINIGSSVTFSSYPTQVALFKYVNLSNSVSGSGTHNFTLGTVPGNVVSAYLSNNTFNSSIDLVIPTDPRPVVTNQPVGFSGSPGSTVTLNVGVDGVAPFTYQWRRDGTNISDSGNISGTATDTLTITSAQPSNNGSYTAVITNAYGSTTSLAAVVTISSGNVAPSCTGPNNTSVLQGDTAVLSATSSGVPAPAYQWFKNGVAISGETTTTLTIPNAQYPADEAVYSFRATNVAGVCSNSATLTVVVPPGISTQPASVTVPQGSPAAFTVVATGHPNPTYQWSKNNSVILDATNATLSFASAQPSDAANYAVLVSNPGGSTNSVTVTLTVTSTTLTYTNLSPANSASGICYDTPLYMRFNNNPTLGTGTLRIYDATDTLVDTIDLSQNQANNGQTRTIGGGTYYTYPVILRSNVAAIFPHLGLMTSNTTYYVLMDAGFFKDAGGASLPAITSTTAWRFTTKVAGPDTATVTNIVIAGDGSGDFVTVQGAIDWVLAGNTTPINILVKKGIYEEINRIPSGKNNLTFIGEGCQESIITYANNNAFQLANAGTSTRGMFYAGGNDCVFKNLVLTNSTPQGGSQAEAIRVQGLRIILDNCKLASFQDTVLINTANTSSGYFNKSLIQGDVDFIWGSGIGFFDKCEVRAMQRSGNSGGIYTQARTGSGVYGFIFRDCDVTKSAPGVTNNWTLGRDAGDANPYGNVVWLNCRMDDHINGAGWSDGGLTDKSTLRFWEYLSRNITDTAYVATNARVSWSMQLDATTAAAASDPTNVFNSITWVPLLPVYIACPPTNQTAYRGSTVTISSHVGGIPQPVYQWYKGASAIPGATKENLVLANAQAGDAASYSVRATNDLGSAISSSGTLTVVAPPSLASPTVLGNGNVQFTFNGIAGTGYRVWASADAGYTPITSTWSNLSSGTFAGAPVTFTDTQAVSYPNRFYVLTLP